MKQTIIATVIFLFLSILASAAEIEKVHVIFKTHLDIGYTDLLTKVRQRYVNEFIPKAIAVGELLAAENSKDRYIWTTGS